MRTLGKGVAGVGHGADRKRQYAVQTFLFPSQNHVNPSGATEGWAVLIDCNRKAFNNPEQEKYIHILFTKRIACFTFLKYNNMI